MYCVPKFQTRLQFLANPEGKEDSQPQPIRYPMRVDGAAQTLRSYRFWESGIGGLASTEALAAVLFKEFPAVGRVSIRVYKTRFDVETAMLVAESSWTTYDRRSWR